MVPRVPWPCHKVDKQIKEEATKNGNQMCTEAKTAVINWILQADGYGIGKFKQE